MLTAVARLSLRAPRRMAAAALVVFIVFAVVGGPTAGLLKDRNSFQDPSSQSARAERAIQRATGRVHRRGAGAGGCAAVVPEGRRGRAGDRRRPRGRGGLDSGSCA